MSKLILYLVHGTELYLRNKPRIPWIEEGPQKSTAIGVQRGFRSSVRSHLETLGHHVEFRPIRWSGRNRHADRLAAAKLIEANVQSTEAGAIPFVIAHGHGGNAAMLAVKGAGLDVRGRLAGSVCMSTPFLLVRESAWAVIGTIALLAVAALVTAATMFGLMDGSLFALGPIALTVAVFTAPIFLLYRRFKKIDPWRQSPQTLDVPLMIVRSARREAAGGLGIAEVLARVVQQIEHLVAAPVRLARSYSVRRWLMVGAGVAVCALVAALIPNVREWFAASWPWMVGLTLGPVLIGMVLRLVIYGFAFGLDLFGLPLVHSISAESTPLGRWMTYLVEADENEKRMLTPSDPLDLRAAHRIIAAWIDERVKARAARVANNQRAAAAARPGTPPARQPARVPASL